jgi:GMP synthase-like glutamine amidotransferase
MLENSVAFDQVKLYAGDPIPDPLSYHALLVMGGPMSVYDEVEYPFFAEENELIKRAVTGGLPFLGICLGGQLLAKALDAPVTVNAVKEIGFGRIFLTEEGKRDRLFRGLGNPLPVFQWHGDTFAIPRRARHLAASDTCAHQAFRYGGRAYALQFHLEVTPAMLREWADIYQEELEALGPGVREGVLPHDLDSKCSLLRAEAVRLFENFLLLVKEARPL